MPELHTSRLRERILAHFSYMKACKSGKKYILTYDKTICDAMFQAYIDDHI